jgi:transcription elongation GreA/GreB family factor
VKDQITIKKALHDACTQQVDKRIKTIEERLQSLEESKNNETKSSVGDKYETGRAMMQMEEEKSKAQLYEAIKVKQELSRLNTARKFDKAALGSLVVTTKGDYYLSIGIGKVKLGSETYYCISTDSPIGRLLIGRVVGEEITFNKQRIVIEEIC